jgi:hypothetical protein
LRRSRPRSATSANPSIGGGESVATNCVTRRDGLGLIAIAVAGVGIAVPTFAPPLLAALILLRRYAGPLAYIGGCIGVRTF